MGLFFKKKYPIGTIVHVPDSVSPGLGYGEVIDISNDFFKPGGGTQADPLYAVQFAEGTLWFSTEMMEKYAQ